MEEKGSAVLEADQIWETTPQDFALYEAVARLMLERLGLQRWEVGFEHADADELGGALAMCNYRMAARSALLSLANEWPIPPTTELVTKYAVHEVLELQLVELSVIAESRSWDEFDFENQRHAVIRVWERELCRLLAAETQIETLERQVENLNKTIKKLKKKLG